MKLSLIVLALIASAPAFAGGRAAPKPEQRGVAASKEEHEKPRKSCVNGEELQEDGSCVRIEHQKPYRPDRD